MDSKKISINIEDLPQFDRRFFGSKEVASYIGSGFIGGKASGLAFIKDMLEGRFGIRDFNGFALDIPRFVVIGTEIFNSFMQKNDLYEIANSDEADDIIAHAFQKADLPAQIVGDLHALIAGVHTPLAIRSSSLLEDAMHEPFAGVYCTKMIPNNQLDSNARFRELVKAIKFVYASCFFKDAKNYITATGKLSSDEKMAIIIQEVVGSRFGERFYPHISGVARSFNFYPIARARPENGVVYLALGLGKTIVDGGLAWCYTPDFPKLTPPVGSISELLKNTQTAFWAVNMGAPPEYNPIKETEYLIEGNLSQAEKDGTLKFISSTYKPQDDRLVSGTGTDGPRVITFAPILRNMGFKFNEIIIELMKLCEQVFASEVEIEFAVILDPKSGIPARFGFLQVRPMVVSRGNITISDADLQQQNLLAASDRVMGNGVIDSIQDIIYVSPDNFEARYNPKIARELEVFNRQFLREGKKYLLIGFGRWGSVDPWLGIPVDWGQISAAKTIIEATLPNMDVELSQGSHFFHNISSFQVLYFMIPHTGKYKIDWEWLKAQRELGGTSFLKHVYLDKPLTIKVDGRSGKGVILK